MARGCAAKNYNIEMYEEKITEYTVSPRSLRRQASEKSAPRIGQRIGSMAKRVEPFDPNAMDGDGDMKVQDGSIHERIATPSKALFSGASPRIADQLMEKVMNGQDVPESQIEQAELIDSAILEQFQIAAKIISPKQAESTREIVEKFEVSPGKKKPSNIFVIKKAIEKYNKDNDTDFSLESIVAGLIEEDPEYEKIDMTIRGHFFSSDKSNEKALLAQHQSKKYKYGDKSALGGEIRANRSDWLRGLTPEQISELIVPETMDDAFNMHLDMTYGSNAELVRNNQSSLKRARALFDGYTNSVSFSKDETSEIKISNKSSIEYIKDSVQRLLSDRPEFYEALTKFGSPPIIPFDTGDEIDDVGGWYDYNMSYIGIPSERINKLERASIEIAKIERKVDRGEAISISDELNAVFKLTTEKAITHEWGHYLHHMVRRGFRRKNGVVNKSPMGINKSGYDKFDKSLENLEDIALNLTNKSRINNPGAGTLEISDQKIVQNIEKNRNAIMDNAKDFSNEIFKIANDLAAKKIDQNQARNILNQLMAKINSGGVLSAPTIYGSLAPHEQFAELISFFFSGPLTRKVMPKNTVDFLTEAFATILPREFDAKDKTIKEAEDSLK